MKMVLFDLTGKKAIVTGGSRGLGAAMAEGLMEFGAETVIIGSSKTVMETADQFCNLGYRCTACQADLGEINKLPALMDRCTQLIGGEPDILINSAGIQRRHKSEEFPLEDWEEVIQVNLTSVFRLCQLAGKYMLKRGQGKIINVASMLSFFGGYTVPAYAASKGGIAQLTKALANEWAGRNVQVNAIAPGYMETDMNTALLQNSGRNQEITARIPAGRWGKPEDMKGIAVFLASQASDYLSGAVIPVDGGYLSR